MQQQITGRFYRGGLTHRPFALVSSLTIGTEVPARESFRARPGAWDGTVLTVTATRPVTDRRGVVVAVVPAGFAGQPGTVASPVAASPEAYRSEAEARLRVEEQTSEAAPAPVPWSEELGGGECYLPRDLGLGADPATDAVRTAHVQWAAASVEVEEARLELEVASEAGAAEEAARATARVNAATERERRAARLAAGLAWTARPVTPRTAVVPVAPASTPRQALAPAASAELTEQRRERARLLRSPEAREAERAARREAHARREADRQTRLAWQITAAEQNLARAKDAVARCCCRADEALRAEKRRGLLGCVVEICTLWGTQLLDGAARSRSGVRFLAQLTRALETAERRAQALVERASAWRAQAEHRLAALLAEAGIVATAPQE